MSHKPRSPDDEARRSDSDGTAQPTVQTPLTRMLLGESKRRATPEDAFRLARRKYLRGERLEIGQIAAELGVGRATVFRWVGSREALYGAVIGDAYARLRRNSEDETPGRGVERVVNVVRRNLQALLNAPPLRKFIEQDPEFAIRVLTSKSSPVQARVIAMQAELLQSLVDKGEIRPALDVDTLAFTITRIGESFLYADAISGRPPDIDKAIAAIRILVSAEPEHLAGYPNATTPARETSSDSAAIDNKGDETP